MAFSYRIFYFHAPAFLFVLTFPRLLHFSSFPPFSCLKPSQTLRRRLCLLSRLYADRNGYLLTVTVKCLLVGHVGTTPPLTHQCSDEWGHVGTVPPLSLQCSDEWGHLGMGPFYPFSSDEWGHLEKRVLPLWARIMLHAPQTSGSKYRYTIPCDIYI
jgi:hypothetical protein